MTAHDDLARVLRQTRLDAPTGVLIAAPELGREWLDALAEAVIRDWVPSLWTNTELVEAVATSRSTLLDPTVSVLRALSSVLGDEGPRERFL